MRKNLLLILGSMLLIAFPAWAEYKPGVHYKVLAQPVRQIQKDKIEVVEVFWYGCIHCFRFEKPLKAWKSKLAKDVNFVPLPSTWRGQPGLHARAFFTLQALGQLDKVHDAFFKALNTERKVLNTKEKLADFVAQHGVDKKAFLATFDSFGINSIMDQTMARLNGYQIEGTPEMVVAGKYRVSGSMVGSAENMLKVVDYLIEKERQEKAKK